MAIQDNNYPKGSTPVPDPTILTTQQLVAAIAASREILETRLDAMDTATELNKEATDKIPNMIRFAVESLEKLHNEKFNGVEKQFSERDSRSVTVSELNQKALDAALQAAKEAAGKTELSFIKQISDLTEQFNTQNKAMDVRVNDLKGRLDRGEGGHTEKQETRGQSNWIIGLVVVATIQIIGVILLFLK